MLQNFFTQKDCCRIFTPDWYTKSVKKFVKNEHHQYTSSVYILYKYNSLPFIPYDEKNGNEEDANEYLSRSYPSNSRSS